MEDLKRLDAIFTEYIRPATFPVAIKFFKPGEELNFKVRRPLKQLSSPLAICQGVALARRYGWSMGFGSEDHACPLGYLAFGHKESPDFAQAGNMCVGLYTKTLEAGALSEAATVKMPVGSVAITVMAPLNKAEFIPDVILIYCTPGQAVRLIQGANYLPGGYVESRFAGRLACSAEMIVPHLLNKYNVIIPGGGEKAFAATENDEMAFAFPYSKTADLIAGIEGTHASGVARFPVPLAGIRMQPAMPPLYAPLEEYCDMKEPKQL